MEYTKNYKKATRIEYLCRHHDSNYCGRYIGRPCNILRGAHNIANLNADKEEFLQSCGKSENEIIEWISSKLKNRWATSIYANEVIIAIKDEENTAPPTSGASYVNYFGGPCGYLIKHLQLTCKLTVTDNHGQNHDIVLYTAIGKNTGPHPGGNAHPAIKEIEYTDYVRNNLDDIELILDESKHPICDYDLDGQMPYSKELFYKLERENKALAQRLSQMESKMNTLMEFIMLMK
jgi:hypothetical protein